MESSCVYGSHYSLFIYSTSKICIKVFKAKCGDKIYMWVMVFSATGRCIRWCCCYCILNGLFCKRDSHSHLLKNTNKFWLMIPAFYHFTIEFTTRETITTKTKHFVFFGIFVKAKVEIIEAATSDTESYFPTGTKRLIRILKRTLWDEHMFYTFPVFYRNK